MNLRTCDDSNNPSSHFILFDSANRPYRVLLDSGANVSFINFKFAQSFPDLKFVEVERFPIFLVSSSSQPSYWVSKKARWTFNFSSSFPIFEWDLYVLDTPGMDDTILGHDFLVHWNPDVDWGEGVINLRTNPTQSTNLSSSISR